MKHHLGGLLGNMQTLAGMYTGADNLQEVALNYREDKDPILLAYAFVKLFPLVLTQVKKYYLVPSEDKGSMALIELEKALRSYDESRGAKFQTYYISCLKNSLRAEMERLSAKKRTADRESESLEENAVVFNELGYNDDAYNEIGLHNMVKKKSDLTQRERLYCQVILMEKGELTDTEIAGVIGVTPSGVNYLRKRLGKKFTLEII